MSGRGRKDSKKQKDLPIRKDPERKKKGRKGSKMSRIKEDKSALATAEVKARIIEEGGAFRGPLAGKPSMIQSTYGKKGNFELVSPISTGGLAYYWRENDQDDLPWLGPMKFDPEGRLFDGVSLIQSNFGEIGNLELVAVDYGGHNLIHFWRESGPEFDWHGPNQISEKALVPVFSGNPAIVQNTLGSRGNFDVIVARSEGGFSHYWRDNDDASLPWYGPFDFAIDAGIYDAVTLIQSNFGEPGNLELIARSGNQLFHFWRDSGPEFKWHGPFPMDLGVTGAPSMIQSNFGNKGNFELVVPQSSGGLAHYWRDNDDIHLHWYGPFMFAMNIRKVEGVSLIQSNFGEPGHLELMAQVDGHLAFFWRDSGPDFRWNGPYYLTS
ncbi:MAG: hypothetical protein LUQ22_00885 [Methanotrichaceae archaeon]|nr:hypothetical protein [Methanotrichaceae archaeon]